MIVELAPATGPAAMDPVVTLVYRVAPVGQGTLVRTSLAAICVIATSGHARADGGVIVVGAASQRDRDVIIDTVKSEGTAVNLRFTAPPWSREQGDAALVCLKEPAPWRCIAPVLRSKAPAMIVKVDSDQGIGAPMTVVTAHLVTGATDDASVASRNCEMCNEEALRRTVGELCRELLQRAAARSGRTLLVIRAQPERAEVILDGKPVGRAGGSLATYPGKHTIALHAPGFVATSREVIALDGTTTDVSVALTPDASARARGERDSGRYQPASQFWTGVVVGVGGAAIVAGALLIALDQDPDAGGQQHYYRDSAPLGVVTLGAGVIATAAGLYLWKRTQGAAIALLPRGAAIAWAGTF